MVFVTNLLLHPMAVCEDWGSYSFCFMCQCVQYLIRVFVSIGCLEACVSFHEARFQTSMRSSSQTHLPLLELIKKVSICHKGGPIVLT